MMIGIAGGVGPFAGIDLVQKIMEETLAGKDQEHLPVTLVSVPEEICDRTRYLEGKEKENPALALSKVLLMLEAAGATVAAIPCNTAHAPAIFNVINEQLTQHNAHLQLLNMIQEVTNYLSQEFPGKAIGVLCTMGTWKNKVYQNAFDQAGIPQIVPGQEHQEAIHSAIYHPEYGIKSQSKPVSPSAIDILEHHAQMLVDQGAELILLGCTEIPLALTGTTVAGVPVVDANRILARSLIKHSAPHKLKHN